MVKKEELRIGNLIKPISNEKQKATRDVAIVEGVTDDGGVFTNGFERGYCSEEEDFEPIKLTIDWLVGSGFTRDEEAEDVDWYVLNGFEVAVHEDAGDVFFVYKHMVLRHILNIHQFQNLYFAITGKELVFNSVLLN